MRIRPLSPWGPRSVPELVAPAASPCPSSARRSFSLPGAVHSFGSPFRGGAGGFCHEPSGSCFSRDTQRAVKRTKKRQGKIKKKKQGGEENHQKFPSTTRVHPPPCHGGSAGVWERCSPEPEVSLGFPMFPSRHRWRGRGWGERPRPSIAPAPGGGRARWAGSGPPSAGCRLPWGPRRSSGPAWCPWSAGSAGQGRARGQQHPQVWFFREESLFLPMGR